MEQNFVTNPVVATNVVMVSPPQGEGEPGESVRQVKTLENFRMGTDKVGYRDIIKNGGNATTILTAERNTFKSVLGKVSGTKYSPLGNKPFSQVGERTMVLDWLDNHSYNDTSFKDDVVTKARTKMIEKIAKLNTPFQGQAFIGELDETIKFLRNPLKTFAELTSRIVKQNNAKYKVKELAALWLEYRFAVLPLIADVQDIMALVNKASDSKKVFQLSAYMSDEHQLGLQRESLNASLGVAGGFTSTVTVTRKYECCIKAGLRFEVAPGEMNKVLSSIGNVRDIPATVWELIPFSWLVDYFVNVDDVLKSATTDLSTVSFTSESLIATTTVTELLTPRLEAFADYIPEGGTPTHFTYEKRTVVRGNSNLGIAPLVFSLPGSNVRYGNIAALAIQLHK